MFRKIIEHRTEKRRVLRTLLADAVMRKIDAAGELILDKALCSELRASRREVLQAACSLVLAEKMHLFSGIDNVTHLQSNQRFRDSVFSQALDYDSFAIPEGLDAPFTDPDAETIIIDSSSLVLPPPTETVPVRPKQPAETAATAVDRANLPDGRKTLPMRDREPWWIYDAVEIPISEDTKKT